MGHEPLKSSLRQSRFPLVASKQERTPATPSVQTFPSTTAGELRGPEWAGAAPPVTTCAAYLSCQRTLPLVASRQVVTSSPSCRVKSYNLSPTIAGVESPIPTATFHFCVSSLGQVAGALKPVTFASRLGPRH